MTTRSTLSVITLSTLLVACGDEATVDPAAFEALQLELAALQLEHAGDIAMLQNDLITLQQDHDDDIAALEEELAAITGGLDLTELSDAIDDHDERLTSIEADYALESDLAGVRGRVSTIEADYLQASDISALASESYVDSAVAGIDLSTYATHTWVGSQGYLTSSALSAYALDADLAALNTRVSTVEADYLQASDISDHATESYVDSAVASIDSSAYALSADLVVVHSRVSTIEADYLLAADLAGYATQAWVGSQGYSTDSVDATLVDLLDYLIVDTSTDSIVFEGANVHVQSGSGFTNGTVNGLGNLFVGYNEDASWGLDRTGSHNLVVGQYHSYSSWGGLAAGQQNTVSGEASVAFGNLNEASGYYSSITGGYYSDASGDASSITGGFHSDASGDYSSISGGYNSNASGDYSSISGGYLNSATGDYATMSGGYNNVASGDISSVSGGSESEAGGDYSSTSGGYGSYASGSYDWAAGGLWEDD
jgi:hypothetical protein